jgi:hypothetical protein
MSELLSRLKGLSVFEGGLAEAEAEAETALLSLSSLPELTTTATDAKETSDSALSDGIIDFEASQSDFVFITCAHGWDTGGVAGIPSTLNRGTVDPLEAAVA